MKIKVNGTEREFPEGSTLGEVLKGEPHHPGTAVSVLISTELAEQRTNEYELVFERGTMCIKVDDSPDADLWRGLFDSLVGNNVRWNTSKVMAMGSFPTEIPVDKGLHMRRRYDVFFSLGGFDSNTTYLMFSKHDHRGRYGAGGGRVGKVTWGRHLLDKIKEGESVKEIRPLVQETSSENAENTEDMDAVLYDGMAVESHVTMDLETSSAMGAEHLLVTLRNGVLNVTERTESFISCSDNLSKDIDPGITGVRQEMDVTVRTEGRGAGRIYLYKRRRQNSDQHTKVGNVAQGSTLLMLAENGQRLTVLTRPERALAVGMTQSEGEEFLSGRGIEQERQGDTADDAVIVDQTPEMTIEALKGGKAVTFGARSKDIFILRMDRENAASTVRYLERVTGLDHKPVGSLQVHFTFKGLPMVTFEGDNDRGKSLYPENEFSASERGHIGITNQVRPHAGLIGIRLEGSKEYGPTGEEPYGTNIVGRFADDIDRLMDGLKEGQTVYVKEESNDEEGD